MKTILVVFTKQKLSESEASEKKGYAYNTESDIQVGDFSKTEGRTVQITKIYDEHFKYVSKSTGELSNNDSGKFEQYPIRRISLAKIEESDED